MSSTQPKSASYKYFDVMMAIFVIILVISNIASSAKIVDLGFSLFGIRLAFDGGTLLFPLAYVMGDVLTEVYGFKSAMKAIWTGFMLLVFTALVFYVLRTLPGENSWEIEAGTAAYDSILGGISSGGIVLASLAGYIVGEFFNSMLLSRIKVLMMGRLFWIRAIGSSIAGELLDSFVFVSIACFTGVFGWHLFASLVLTNYLLKLIIEVLVLPGNYAAVHLLKKLEGVDVYDTGKKYSLFG